MFFLLHTHSDLRPVPDHQEVFAHRSRGLSVIVEIVERPDQVDDGQAPDYFFSDLAQCNSVASNESKLIQSHTLESSQLPHVSLEAMTPKGSALLLTGTQQVQKPPLGKHPVSIVMALIRLPNVSTDIIITVNNPVLQEDGTQLTEETALAQTQQVMTEILSTFTVKDWNLFG